MTEKAKPVDPRRALSCPCCGKRDIMSQLKLRIHLWNVHGVKS